MRKVSIFMIILGMFIIINTNSVKGVEVRYKNKMGIFAVGSYSINGYGDLQEVTLDAVGRDGEPAYSIGGQAGVKYYISSYFGVEAGYGYMYTQLRIKVEDIFGNGTLGYYGQEVRAHYFPINIMFNIKVKENTYLGLGGGISIYDVNFFQYRSNSDESIATYVEGKGSSIGGNFKIRAESFIFGSNRLTIFSDMILRLAKISELKDTTYNKTLKKIYVSTSEYGDTIAAIGLSDLKNYENFNVNLSGLQITFGITYYIDL